MEGPLEKNLKEALAMVQKLGEGDMTGDGRMIAAAILVGGVDLNLIANELMTEARRGKASEN